MHASTQPGFYGKVPALGDFVTRRLPREFTEPWDAWLQSAFASSREQLGTEWLDHYLTSPIWRFVTSAGVIGSRAWAGVLMPSVDRVGRYFPLTLAAPLDTPGLPAGLLDTAVDWYAELERLALSALDDEFDVEHFDEALQRLPVPACGWSPADIASSPGATSSRFALHVSVETSLGLPAAFAGVGAAMLERFVPFHSLWCSGGSDSIPPSVLVCDGLPPIDAYAALLAGRWDQRGWALNAYRRHLPPSSQAHAIDTEDLSPVQDVDAAVALQWVSEAISDVGLRRRVNEDAYLERPDAGLWVVADGMGGHQAGDVASGAVVNALADIPVDTSLDAASEWVTEALTRVNRELCNAAESSDSGQIIGCTVVVLLIRGRLGLVMWAGDSRLYRYRKARLEQLTRDHSLFDDALMGSQQVAREPGPDTRCNIITRAVGADPDLYLETLPFDVRAGDIYLLCTDGLDKEIDAARIAEILAQASDVTEGVRALVEAALERGARDNVTTVLVRANQPPADSPPR